MLINLINVARKENESALPAELLRIVEETVLDAMDQHSDLSQNDQNRILEFFQEVDTELNNQGIDDFIESDRLKLAYKKLASLSESDFFQRGALKSFRTVRQNLWQLVGSKA